MVSRVKRRIRCGLFRAGSELAVGPATKHAAIENATARDPLARLGTRRVLRHDRFDMVWNVRPCDNWCRLSVIFARTAAAFRLQVGHVPAGALSETVSKGWALFQSELPEGYRADRKRFTRDLVRLNHIRNSVMHPVKERKWSEDDFFFVRRLREFFGTPARS